MKKARQKGPGISSSIRVDVGCMHVSAWYQGFEVRLVFSDEERRLLGSEYGSLRTARLQGEYESRAISLLRQLVRGRIQPSVTSRAILRRVLSRRSYNPKRLFTGFGFVLLCFPRTGLDGLKRWLPVFLEQHALWSRRRLGTFAGRGRRERPGLYAPLDLFLRQRPLVVRAPAVARVCFEPLQPAEPADIAVPTVRRALHSLRLRRRSDSIM